MSITSPQPRQRLSSDVARQFTAGSASAAAGSLIHTWSYALWFGGLVVLGAVVAPNVAGLLQEHPEIAGNATLKDAVLNGAIGNSFRALNDVAFVCGLLMLLGDWLEARGRSKEYARWSWYRATFTILALTAVAWQAFVLFPRMDAAQVTGNMAEFDHLHVLYELVGIGQMTLLLFVPLGTAIRIGQARNA